jgi:hypothetical protein
MHKILLQLFLIVSFCTAGIVFQKEKITVTIISCDSLEVQGIYFFVNSDTLTTSNGVYYPFPVDSILKYPYYISVVRLSNHRSLPYVNNKDGITWDQVLLPHSTDSIQVTYRQKTLKPNSRYILTTTQNWERPLEQADFIIITPTNIRLNYWSFQSDSVNMYKGDIRYYSFKKHFFPERDMLFEWKCK